VFPAESVTFTVNDPAVSTAFGVPLITPALDRLNPTADSPVPLVTLHVYPEALPPAAVSVVEYAVPSTPLGTLLVVTERVGYPMVRLNVIDAVSLAESVTFTVNDPAVSTAFGVPLITPPLDKLNPTADSPVPLVTLHVYPALLPPVAVSVAE
jgi:hypothetical protein